MQVLFFYFILLLGVIVGQVRADDVTPIVQPNVTIDLNPKGTKTVIPEKPKPAEKEEANIFLNFENASLESVLNYLAEEKKINVLPHKGLVEAKVTLSTRRPLTLERAWNILLTILEMSGYTINQVGDLYRVVVNKENGREPLPCYISKKLPPDDLPETSQVIRYVYFLTNIKEDAVKSILAPMLEGEGNYQFNADLQACILKEKCINIKAAMKIIKELDLGGMRESIRIISLQEADAGTIAKLLEDIIGTADKDKAVRFSSAGKKKETTYFSSTTKIIPYGLKNSLILLGNEKNINRVVDFIYKYLDVPIGSADSRLHIKEIRYAKASDIAALVEQMVKPPGGQGADKTAAGRYKFFEDVIFKAEEASVEGRGGGNRLIVSCNQEDWVRIEDFIDSIDKPQPQVALELMIVSLTEQQSKSLGVQMQSKAGKEIGMGINRAEFNNLGSRAKTVDDAKETEGNPAQNLLSLAAGQSGGSPSMMTFGHINVPDKTNNIWALIRATFNITNSQIIGQPYLVANNHAKDCKIELNDTRRLDGPLVSKGGEPQKATKEEVKAGTQVNIVPQINSDGVVDLTLTINLDQFEAASISADAQPVKIIRNIVTKASMVAGEVLVLGGFKTSNQTIKVWKTPLLADIPIIGSLFKSKEKVKTEDYLYIFIRPSIIKPQFEGSADEYTQLKLDYAKYQVIRNDTYTKDRDPIQRWYFKPSNYTIKQKLDESRLGIFAPIDDFAQGKNQPKTVDIKGDPYFKVSEAVAKQRRILMQRRTEQKVAEIPVVEIQQPAEQLVTEESSSGELRGLAKIAQEDQV